MDAGKRIDDRVIQAHVDHFCPGGAGFPVTSPHAVGLDLEEAASLRNPPPLADEMARAAGDPCGRCGQPLAARQPVRRRACGSWVHETCPAAGGAARTSETAS